MSPIQYRAGEWLLHSGIQESNGGVARYYCADLERNLAVSTEITGYTVSALVYLHSLGGDTRYLRAALSGGHFLVRHAWQPGCETMPFELGSPGFTYFFDCGIIVRGLLALWRASGEEEFLATATALGRVMARDFESAEGYHPILSLPGKQPVEHEAARWSRAPGCYQLKSAMSWWDLWEATADPHFRAAYERMLELSLPCYTSFLPGPVAPLQVMDRLHAFAYFLEGLLPVAEDPRARAALCDGIRRMATHLERLAPEFERADVYAQLLRIRLYADWAGASPLDRDAAAAEAARLATFQATGGDPRIDGGFYFGQRNGAWMPYINPVSTAFALQALAQWDAWRTRGARADRTVLI